jgi:hypothetical protein
LSFKPRKFSEKKQRDVITNLGEKCTVCGKLNGHHSRAEAIACGEEKSQPWSSSVEPEKMKKKMGFRV